MRVLRQRSAFRGDSSFLTWALAIAVRVAWDELRRRRWRDVSLEGLLEAGDHASGKASADHDRSMAREQTLEALRRAMSEHLTERQMVALAAELKGMPQSEIAQRIGSNRNAVYKLTHDARRRLKQVLSEQGITGDTIRWAFASVGGAK